MEQKATSKQYTGPLRGLKLALLAVGSSLILAGCADNPSIKQFTVTGSAVNNMISASSPEYAPVEMRSAQDKPSQARIVMNDKEYDQAKHLARQTEWDARVAEHKTQVVKVQKAVRDARQGVMELRKEGMRDAQHQTGFRPSFVDS